ncbi:hypothetical protein DZC30_00825 [Comamonas testosteroni]|uniref:Uncharacterized protein n=1 Tax=Comamonas testosteroni TaxID=285 RepID=A0A373FTV6_COMTE|nr:hypothetical protein DZC30_00825 [Comamonas testosteroni]
MLLVIGGSEQEMGERVGGADLRWKRGFATGCWRAYQLCVTGFAVAVQPVLPARIAVEKLQVCGPVFVAVVAVLFQF